LWYNVRQGSDQSQHRTGHLPRSQAADFAQQELATLRNYRSAKLQLNDLVTVFAIPRMRKNVQSRHKYVDGYFRPLHDRRTRPYPTTPSGSSRNSRLGLPLANRCRTLSDLIRPPGGIEARCLLQHFDDVQGSTCFIRMGAVSSRAYRYLSPNRYHPDHYYIACHAPSHALFS
jgi:hypothetical protein